MNEEVKIKIIPVLLILLVILAVLTCIKTNSILNILWYDSQIEFNCNK